MGDKQLTSDDKVTGATPWGLRLISDATSEARPGGAVVDIIAVHGLGANPDHAWVRHKDISAGLEKDVRWLTDLLPQTFRDYKTSLSARIFCFNYQSAWLGPQLSKNRLEGLAWRLLDEIHNVRDKDDSASDRPLIFIGHSFGGLVIEQAIVQANSAGGRYEYLVKLIGGVVLLGTPHQGSKSQKWGSIMANLANLIDYGETGLMKEVDEKSMKIFDLISQFKKIMISMDLAKTAVICFYENRSTNYVSRVTKTGKWIQKQTSAMVVEETSAVLSGFYSIVLDSDHLKLNKFPSAQDGNYVSVSSNLCRIAAEAPELIRRHQKEPLSVQSSHFLVPRKRVKDFIGRDSLLEDIRSHFSSTRTGSPLQLILYALGGQGKSQIALEYCRKWRDTYRGIFWIDANSETTAMQSYSTIAAKLMGGSQVFETSDSAIQIEMVKGHLERWSEAWLLVFDNYDDPQKFLEVEQFIPIRGCGHVLFTSRNRDLGRLGTLLEIPPMTTQEGVRLLLRGYNGNDIQEPHQDTAWKIIKRLGGLALAIDQAAAYIKYKRMPLDHLGDFLTTYEAERQNILSYTPKHFWEYKHINAITTWELSFQQLGSGDEPWKKSAAHFLTLSAFFAPTTITESMFRYYHIMCDRVAYDIDWIRLITDPDGVQDERDDKDDKHDKHTKDGEGEDKDEDKDEGEDEDEDEDEDKNQHQDEAGSQSSDMCFHGSWNPRRFWDVLVSSEELSLLQSISPGMGREGANFSLHPLIRDWLQLRLKAKERADYVHEAILVLVYCAKAYDGLPTSLGERTALITHMDVSLSNEEQFLEPHDRLGHQIASCDAASWFAHAYKERGRYRTSEDLYRRMLEIQRCELRENHPDTLRSMNNLASSLHSVGKYEEAERMYRETLTMRETELGKEHPDTQCSMNNFAYLLSCLGNYEEAERMYRQILTLRETNPGKKHPDTLISMNNLAVVLCEQNKHEEAEQIYRETLTLTEMIMGKEHPSTLMSMNNLASVLSDQNSYEEAEQIYRETLILSETILGKNHPHTLLCMNNLALVLCEQNKNEEAEQIYRETLTLKEMIMGKEHPSTLMSMNNLASVLCEQNNYEEAEQIQQETLTLRRTVLGKNHPSTLNSINNLSTILYDQHKYEEAERLCQETLVLRETVLGKDHPDMLQSMHHLSWIFYAQDKYEEAERICRETLTLRQAVLGAGHPGTVRSRKLLTGVLESQGKYEEARLLAAVRATEESDINTAACPLDVPASLDLGDVARLSSMDAQGAKQPAQLSKKGKGHEADEDNGSEREEGGKGERRRERMARWAKRTMGSMKSLRLASKSPQPHPTSTSRSADPTGNADPQHRMQSSSQSSTQ